jgi:UrcA family protein
MNYKMPILLAAALVASLSTSGFAQSQVSQSISYADLDLSNARDQNILKHRISRTAAVLCDQDNDRFGASVRKAQRDCRAAAIHRAMEIVLARQSVTMAAR